MASPPTPKPVQPRAHRDWLKIAVIILAVGATTVTLYGLTILYSVSRLAYGDGLVTVGVCLLAGVFTILVFVLGRKPPSTPGT